MSQVGMLHLMKSELNLIVLNSLANTEQKLHESFKTYV